MEVELDLWSSRDDAVDHILSDVDCLGDVVGDVDVDEFMLACSSAEASQVAVPGDEHPASFTPEPALHHHDDLTGLHQQMQRQRQQQHGHGHGQRLHHQMVADSQHMNLNSMFDETLMGHHNHQQQQQQHQTATSTFQQQHQQQAELHFGANRLTQNDLQHHHFEQNQHHSNFGPPAPHQNDLIPLNSLVIEHQSGAPFVHQFATIQQQPQPHQQASNTSSSSSLVAARVDHCYITAESPTSEPSLQQARAEQLEPVSTSISLPDREQLQMLLDSRPQPISCPLGESPLIAVINSKSLEPLSQSKSSSAATTLKRRQQTGASVAATSPKRQTKKQQATTTLTIRLEPVQAAISSSEQQPAGRLNKSRNNNAKRAETMAKSSAGARSARGKQRAPCSGSGSKLTGHQLDAAEHQVSGQISPTLSSSSSSGISSQSSNYSDELAEGSRLDETGSSSSSSGGQLFPDSASPNAATPSNKRRRHTTPTGGKRSPAGRKPATTSSEFQESSSASQAAVQGKNERNLDDKLAISSSSPKAGKNPSQLSFEANLSAESREKLSSLSSCLISQPAGEQQQQQCNNSQPSSNQLEQAAIKAPPTASQPGRQRSSVSSSSSISSCSSMSLAACSPPNSLAGFVVSSAGPLASSTSASSSSSSASCSSFGSSSMQSPASERLASPVSSASCSPTMQLGSSNSSVGLNSSSGSSSSQLPATSSSCSFSSSLSSSSSSSSSSCSSSVYSAHQSASLISSQDWKSAASGQTVQLTEEERRTLLAAGYPIPQKFPLSKAEERSLKKIRRKIKNKISAQESRRKKKEYMEELEKRVQVMELRICELERENASLLKGSRRASSASSASSNSSSSPQSANNKSASKRSSQQRMRQSAKSSASDNNKGPSRASSTGADLAMNATMTTLSPVHQHQQQPNSLDLLRSFAVNCKQELAEAGAADATGQLVITQPREKTQTAKLGQQQQQVDSFHQLGACDNLVLIDTEQQQQQQQQQQDRCAPDSAHTPQLIQPAPAAKRKDSIQSQANDDDNFIDQILLSQERQEAGEGACGAQTTADGHDVEPEVDLVANLGVDGVVVEPADIKVERHEMVVDSI